MTRLLLVGVSLALVGCSSGSGGPASGGAAGAPQGAAGNGDAGAAGTGGASGGGGGAAAGAGGAAAGAGGAIAGAGGATGPCGPDVVGPEENLGTGTDPEAGDFTLDEALAGLPPGPGPLRAVIETKLGVLTCELFPQAAPVGVANFVGLARGKRAFKISGAQWVRRPFYDGLTFHRVIPDFVAQGGDPKGNGTGGPGYEFVNEASLKHEPGSLAYANSGPDTNGSQFYVAEVALPSLDGGYTVFGRCAEVDVVKALTHVPTTGAMGKPADKPLEPLVIDRVRITRCAP